MAVAKILQLHWKMPFYALLHNSEMRFCDFIFI